MSSKKTGTYFLNVYVWWPRSESYDTVSLNFNGNDSRGSSYDVNTKFPTAESFVSQIQDWFAAYEGSGGAGTEIRDTISKFGSPLPQVTYVSNTGHEFVVTKDTVLTPEPDVQVDAYTTDDFKYGVWYYNAKELRQYADENGMPVLAEYSSAGCDPCQYFKKNVFLNSDFQSWAKKSPYLFCKVDIAGGESFQNEKLYPQPYYIDNVWAKEKYGDSPPSIPVFMWYWKPKGASSPSVFELSTYHFAPNALGAKPPFTM